MPFSAARPESPFDRRRHPDGLAWRAWTAADGWRHRAFHWPAGGGAPGAPRGSLIYQSGRGDFIEKYLEACHHWHRRGWDVQGFDWRGQGGSGRLRPGSRADDRTSFDPLIDDLVAFVTQWRATTPGPHVLVAHSMGAHVALRACAERGLDLDALVLVAPMLALQTRRLPRVVASAAVALARAIGLGPRAAVRDRIDHPLRYLRLTASRERYDDSQWWKRTDPALGMGAPTWNWLGAALAGSRRLLAADRLEQVRTPMLLMTAGLDRLVDNAVTRVVARRLPDATLADYPGARHELLREADGDRVAAFAAIDAFLDQRTPAR
jgi:lysophospholipase